MDRRDLPPADHPAVLPGVLLADHPADSPEVLPGHLGVLLVVHLVVLLVDHLVVLLGQQPLQSGRRGQSG